MGLAVAARSIAWQRVPSQGRGGWKDGLLGPPPGGAGGLCFTLADAPAWLPAPARMQRCGASQLGYAAGINHGSQIFLGKGRGSALIVGTARCWELLSNRLKAGGI